MAAGYEIPIGVEKIQALNAALSQTINLVETLDSKFGAVNGTMGRTQTVGGRTVSAPTNPASGNDDAATTATRARAAAPRGATTRISSLDPYARQGVRERLDYETNQLDRARATGDERLIRDQENRRLSAEKAVQRAEKALNGPTQDDILQDILFTSRIGPGGQLYPLVGKLRQLRGADGSNAAAAALQGLGVAKGADTAALAGRIAGAAEAAGPLLVGAGIATVAAGAIYGVANAGAASMRRGNAAFYALGGSSGNVGAAMALGGDDAAAKAMGFGDRLREGTYGAAFFHSRGIYDMGPNQVDKSGNYVNALDQLRGVRDVQQRIRIARDTGLTDDLWTSDLSDSTYRRLRGSYGDAGSEGERRSEAEYRGQKEIAGGYWNRFVKAVATPAIGYVGDLFGSVTGDLGSLGRNTRRAINALPGGMAIGGALDVAQALFDHSHSEKDQAKPRKGTVNWQDAEPAIGDSPNATNGTTTGAFPAGARARLLHDDIDRLNSYMGGF